MLSFSEMCSLVAVRQEMDSWMKQRMLVEPSQVEQLTLPRACTQACSCEGCSLFRRSIFQTCSEWMGWFGYQRFTKLPFTISEDLCKKCKINKIIGTFNKQMIEMMLIVNRYLLLGIV